MAESVLADMPFSEYLATDRESAGALVHLRKSAAHYKQARYGDNMPAKPPQRRGTTAHCATIEPDRFESEYVVYPGAVRRGKVYDSFKAAHLGKEILTQTEHDQARAIAAAVHAHPVAGAILAEPGRVEVSCLWTEPVTGHLCKARPDYLGGCIADLKTARDAGPREFGNASARYGYWIKAAWYQQAVKECTGEDLPFVLIAVEPEPPYAVACYRVRDEDLHVGRREYRRLLELRDRYAAADEWPSYGDGMEMELSLPPWALGDEGVELVIDGEMVIV